jgi:ubiquinol-cytochrome c reductase cytochrome b subunit
VRTALGVATFAFYAICFLGGSVDILATTFGLSVNATLWAMRALIFLVPPLVGWGVYRLCNELSARDGLPVASKVHWREIPGRLRHGAPKPTADPEPETDLEVSS